MKTLVTGGSGYLGTHVRRFFDADDFSRSSGMDILDPLAVVSVRDYDVVIHLAAQLDKSPEASSQIFLTNVEGTLNILRNVREDAVFIFASTKDVYGRFADNYPEVPETCPVLYSGQSPLEWSKLIAERYVEFYAHQNSFRSCIFRLSGIYAPPTQNTMPNFIGNFAAAIDTGERIALPAGGKPIRDILHVDDFSKACRAFVDSVIKHGLYNLGGGPKNALTLRQLVSKLEEISSLQAVVDEDADVPAPVPMNYVSDLNLIARELAWKPEMPIDKGLETLFRPQL